MATSVPSIQVLSKENYEDQHIVALPNALPLPPLAPSSLRIQSSILGLTTNNFTYARMGHLIGSWWDVHPLPSSIPWEFSDASRYGCISAWGTGVVIESTLPPDSSVQVGSHMYGYFPIGTLPIDMQVELSANVAGQFTEVSTRRSKLMPLYNRYNLQSAASTIQSLGYDALFRVLFETGYLMNRFVFAWNASERVHPAAEPGQPGVELIGDNSIDSNTTVILFAASGKTALGFAHQLKHARPEGQQPCQIVAVGSEATRSFTQGTGYFDAVLTYDADESTSLQTDLGLDANAKIFVVDFGARGGAADRWAAKLQSLAKQVTIYSVGSEAVCDSPTATLQKLIARSKTERVQINASGMRSQALVLLGEKAYYEHFLTTWQTFLKTGGIEGLKLVWGEGLDGYAAGWERLSKGKVGPDEGLVYDLSSALPGGQRAT
ncbi:hypothetical protein PVAG01_00683 [Phlyctema vagabunda]|uniref:Uncharacterized protein n=1 Tax=Phlyctema vagabunda TaxID=108571 RepID=A0ABR4PUY2_9HELO